MYNFDGGIFTLYREFYDYSQCYSMPNECFDLSEIDFGDCEMYLGVGWNGFECVAISGCDWIVDGIDYSEYFYDASFDCLQNCRCEDGEFNNDDLSRSVQTMAIAFSEIIKLCIEDFKKSSCGRIVVISSFVNKSIGLNNKIFPITAAAKGALEALTKTLSFQLARDNVTVNAISPGYTKKDGNHSALSQDEWDKIINKIPLSRLARPEDIANLVNFLLSNEASYITGQVIKVDGGLSLL